MSKAVRKFNIWYLYCCVLFFMLGGWCLLYFEKGELELFVNAHHHFLLDYLFYFGTSIGNGLFYIVILFLIGFYRIGWSIAGSLAFLATGLIVQLMKNIFFAESRRPSAFFEEHIVEGLNFVEGVILHSYQSFPSGHTATAFSMFLLVSLLNQKWWWGVLCFLLAFIAATSRVYLMQHFWEDVFTGALIGTVVTFAVIKLTIYNQYYLTKKWPKKSWIQLFSKSKVES